MSKQVIDSLVFPVVWLKDEENSLGVYRNVEELTKCPRGAENFYNNLRLISSDGSEYKVSSATKIGKAGKVEGLGFLRLFGLYEIIVELDFLNEKKERTNEDLKFEFAKVLKSDEDYWDADGRLDNLLSLIERSTEIFETTNLIKKRYFNEPFGNSDEE